MKEEYLFHQETAGRILTECANGCCPQERSVPIPSLPGQRRLSPSDLLKEIDEARRYGVNAFMLFPKVDDNLKTPLGTAGLPILMCPCAIWYTATKGQCVSSISGLWM